MKHYIDMDGEALGVLEETAASLPEWRLSAVELPPSDELVLAVAWAHGKNIRFEGAYCFAVYYPPEGWILTDWPELEIEKVTHWVPLPEPPAQEEEDDEDQSD